MKNPSTSHRTARERGAYVRLLTSVALDERLDAEALGLLAYRATYAGAFALNRRHLSRVFRLGDAVFKRTIDQLRSSGYICRRRAHDGTSTHARVIESLNLQSPRPDEGYVFIRRLEIERLGVKLTGLYLFVAARPSGQHVYVREVAERFGKTQGTASRWLAELWDRGWIDRVQRRGADGGFDGTVYMLSALPRFHGKSGNATSLSKGIDGCFGATSWINDIGGEGGRIEAWRLGLCDSEKLEEAAEEISDDDIKDALIRATEGRLHQDLLARDGLYGLYRLIAAVSFVTAVDPITALGFIEKGISKKFERLERRLNSLAYVGKIIFGLINSEGEFQGFGEDMANRDEVPF